MIRLTQNTTRQLIGELERRTDKSRVQGAELVNALAKAPDEYVLASSGSGDVSVLKPIRPGVAPAETLNVLDADSGAVLELARRGPDVDIAGQKFSQYVINPLKYDASATVGRPRIKLEAKGPGAWSSVEDLPFVRDLTRRDDLLVRPDPELGGELTSWFDLSIDREQRQKLERALGYSVPDRVHASTIDEAAAKLKALGADPASLGFTTTETGATADLRKQVTEARTELATEQAVSSERAKIIEELSNSRGSASLKPDRAPSTQLEALQTLKDDLEAQGVKGPRRFVGARFSEISSTPDLDRPGELRTVWNEQVRLGKKFSNVPVSARLVELVTEGLKSRNLIPAGNNPEVADMLRGVWFGRGQHVPAFFESVLSDPASAARVESNLTGYLDLIKDSNFNALFPNANDRPEDMLKRVALVGFFSRDNDFRRELYNAIEADVKDESAARVELRTRGQNPPIDVAIIGTGPTGTAVSTSLAAKLKDNGAGARVTVFDEGFNETFKVGAFWRLNSPSRPSEGEPGRPSSGDINYQSSVVGSPDAMGTFWANADTVAQTAAVAMFTSGVPVETASSVVAIRRKPGQGYELEFADGTKQITKKAVVGAGLGRRAKLFKDEATNDFVASQYQKNKDPDTNRLFDWLYRDSLQLFEAGQRLNVPLAMFTAPAAMNKDAFEKLDRNSNDPLFKTYLRESLKLEDGAAIKSAGVRPQKVVGIIGSGDGGNTVAELLTLLGPTETANATPAQLGIRPQVLWFVGKDGPASCVEFYTGQLKSAFEGVQELFDSDAELKGLNLNVFRLLTDQALKAAGTRGPPEQSLANALDFFSQFLGVKEPREFVQKTFGNLTEGQRARIEGAFLKARKAIRPRYNQLVQPIGKGQIKLITDQVAQMKPVETPLGQKLVMTGPGGQQYMVDHAVGCIGNSNDVDEVIDEMLDGRKGKLPVLKDPNLFEFIRATGPSGESQVVGKRLKSDPDIIFVGPGAIADYQQNKTAVGANTVSIFLNKPLNDLVGAGLAAAIIEAEKNSSREVNDKRAAEDIAYASGLEGLAQKQLIAVEPGTARQAARVEVGELDRRLGAAFAPGGKVAFDVALRELFARFRSKPGAALEIRFTPDKNGTVQVNAPEGALSAVEALIRSSPSVSSYLSRLTRPLSINRICDEFGAPTLNRGTAATVG